MGTFEGSNKESTHGPTPLLLTLDDRLARIESLLVTMGTRLDRLERLRCGLITTPKNQNRNGERISTISESRSSIAGQVRERYLCAGILTWPAAANSNSVTIRCDSRVAIVFTANLIFSATSAVTQELPQIPAEFHGIWGWGAEECSAKDWRNKDTLHQVRQSDIEYWESECRVVTLSRSADDPETLVLQLNCSGEGEEWKMDEVWKRFEIGKAEYLIKITLSRNEVRLYRFCR